MTHSSTRRSFVLALPAVAAIPTAAQSGDGNTGLHPEWMDQWPVARARWNELAALRGNENSNHPRSQESERIKREMKHRFGSVPATTVAGAIACMAWREEDMDGEECAFNGHQEAFSNALTAFRSIEASSARP